MKFTRITITFLALFFLGNSLFAQTESLPRNEMNYRLALNLGLFKDQSYSPLNYNLYGGNFFISNARISKNRKRICETSMDLNFNLISTDASEAFLANHLQTNIRFAYLRSIYEVEDKISLYVGPAFQTNNTMVFFNGISGYTYLFNHSLNARAMATYKIDDKQSLKMNLSIPFVNWLVRPPHAGLDKPAYENRAKPFKLLTVGGDLTTFGTYTAFDWNVEYMKKLNQKFSLTLGYGLNVQRVFADEKFIRLNNQMTVGIRKQF